MEIILQNGIPLIQSIQQWGDWLIGPMKFFTFLGREEFYLLIMPALYWCLDTQLGFRLGLILLTSGSLNSLLKLTFHLPRPYWIDTRVLARSIESSFGMPSGHAQNAVSVWGLLAEAAGQWWAWLLAVLLILLISLSRIYLGVHFPTDVVYGWLIGAIVLWGFLRAERWVGERLKNRSARLKIGLAFGASLLFILLGYLALWATRDWQLPASWVQNALQADPEGETIHPQSLSGLITSAAALFGLAAGWVLLSQKEAFDPAGAPWQRIVRYLVGLVGVILIWAGLDAVFPEGTNLSAYSLRYVRYALVGLWISGGGPALFVKLGLASPQSK